MDIIRNFPAISILLCLFAGIFSSGMKKDKARTLNTLLLFVVTILSAFSAYYSIVCGEAIVYVMGKFPAPWGNEIRFGVMETMMATFFCIIMTLCMFGGRRKLDEEIEESKHNLYYVLVDLLLSSLLALVYTNDIFTAYVFVEINTISACGLIMIRQVGRTFEAAIRYMIMSLLGSGLLLMGICMIYDVTGHLLMSNMQVALAESVASGLYPMPIKVGITFMVTGLAIKSALFPFHAWLPDAYGYSTVSSAAMLSSLVSKGYIFFLIKIIYRVTGTAIFNDTHIINILFVFGLCGMIFGSVSAIRCNDIRKMIAFSSVAQIGYIYMGIGLGTKVAMLAALFHIMAHAAAKSLAFISAIGLTDVSGYNRSFIPLTGSGYRNRIAGVGFTIASLSMVGVPVFAGFVSKLLFAEAAIGHKYKVLPTMICLGISTILNAIYFMKTVIRIYTPDEENEYREQKFTWNMNVIYSFSIVTFIVLNITLGMLSQPIIDLINKGIDLL